MQTLKKIVVGVDLDGTTPTAAARRACDLATWVAKRSGGEVELLHSTWMHDDEPRDPSAAEVEALEGLARPLRSDGPDVRVSFTNDRPFLALTRRALAGADLVVVGKHGHEEARPPGPNAKRLLRKCPGFVWVVDPHTRPPGRCVLAATDLSPVGARATQLAAGVAAASGAELHIVHAWQRSMREQLEGARLSDAEARARDDAHDAEARQKILDGLGDARKLADPVLHVGCDSPEHAILTGVERLDAELVVMGTLSRTGVPGLLIGNTAERLVQELPCSMLTLKPADFVSPIT